MSGPRADRVVPAAVVLALLTAWLIYLPGLGGPLLLDDLPQLQPILDQADAAPGELVRSFSRSTSGPTGRPVAMLSFIADAVLHGDDTRWWKHTNLLIHLVCGVLVFGLATVLAGRVHPSSGIRPPPCGTARSRTARPA